MFRDRQSPMVLVLGLGESGLAMARWCARHGCRLRVADTRETPPNLSMLEAGRIEAEFVGGAFAPALLDGGIELVALSPGLSPIEPQLAALLASARERGIPVWGELELFAQALAHLGESGYAPKVVAITGTNGKTTTTSLTGLLCKRAGKRVAVAGNIGPTMLDTLAEAIDATDLPEVWVLELSSFQLETVQTFEPHAATVLNVTQDHLDWHGSFEAYRAAKGRIFGPHTVRVLNRDDSSTMALAPTVDAAKPASSQEGARLITFGLNEPQHSGDYGVMRENGINWLTQAQERGDDDASTASSRRRRQASATSAPVELAMKRLMPVDALRIRGLHNAANALA
ncbi:MAG TPA: Mur ligase family protein, partial [Trinickia sp.]|uniref:Mur ligase family protein n=1 Tax=Trinickia sp. TaxID=2571163 RepID=UPI002BF753EF